ncbi:MAG: hypothetical protein QXU18_06045 [Thermoplasmatales archaeon]
MKISRNVKINSSKMRRRIFSIIIAGLMFSSVYGMIQYLPVSNASVPPSNSSNTAYLNTSSSY